MSVGLLYTKAVDLLKLLIAAPSFSKEEQDTADILSLFLDANAIPHKRVDNNVFAFNKNYDALKPTVLLNSHHDTVKPNNGYTVDPFSPVEIDGKLFGLGSNDAGGSLVSLIVVFMYYYGAENLSFNLVLAASAEEEISGLNGIEKLLPYLGNISFGIVGEPTKMQMAVAERGLMVVDCTAKGIAGHAARNDGENALYKALDEINIIRSIKFDKVSELLGETKLTVTVIETDNRQHNVVPSLCRFVIDARVNECYTFEEVLEILRTAVKSECRPRSTRLRSTFISLDHPLVKAGIELGLSYFGSPTTSDKALMPFTTLKIGPGDSARSHAANEFIYPDEIRNAIDLYIQILDKVVFK